ncbi:HAD-like domain-containing protein [Yarrowia lipolytica]|jgi:HAD superfamily hydrolase (TIGR01549 family)|uniref:HAD-like domain-containing protein n=1 Tax=Yarrowia lipolytica TaxID=4952 RepID=A0A1H6PUN4_YARLL|nr:hypothetical protein YALI1_D26956g [Yarrowia lipolytica]KAB8285771.1 HAD-like domain-containing protein [Yarrowia lipolytica]KAE8169604.1 HAD-like domain-containing protein [Yarrowia lipolytica]KAJ8054112.1 HAD-like domain-containing protein [Yarrowia lipolytica]QNP98277.1 Hypothetical protein YALI2_D00718g [Yarrowia lipolytica]
MKLMLKPTAGNRLLKGIVFDMDGTLCEPQTWMFGQMRAALGIDKSVDILDHVHSLPDPEQEEAQMKLRAIETRAMVDMTAQPGLLPLMDYLKKHSVKKTICTRNFPAPVQHLLDAFLSDHVFEPIVTREFKPPKPHPQGILNICKEWGVEPGNVIMVGDSVDDMAAGKSAGATTILLQSDVNGHLNADPRTDLVINRLDEIIGLIEEGIELKQ